jgi:hypothetical protein
MGSACPKAVALCRRRVSLTAYGGLFEVAERAPRVYSSEAATIAFAKNPAVTWVAILDEHDRPVGLIERRGGTYPPLNVSPAERLPDVARRLASRPAADRLAPAALCDEHGRLVGLLTVERVLGRLAHALDSGSTQTSHDAWPRTVSQ